MKSSCSMYSTFENGTWRTPSAAFSGLLATSWYSTTGLPSASSGQLVITSFSGRSTAIRRSDGLVELTADERLQQLDRVPAVGSGNADEVAERSDGFGAGSRGDAAPRSVGMRGSSHPSTTPSATSVASRRFDVIGVGELEAGELGLAWLVAGQRQVLEVPVVQRPVAVELERAQRVGDALDRIALAVRPVVRRVDDPLVAGAPVVAAADAVHHRIAQLHVLVLHVDLGAQHA